ncbi:MAG: hypothetical protein KGL58_07830 [Pseudomonadota bacterium]|nr:hypothetical protein [Pseudomonadota bacterium]
MITTREIEELGSDYVVDLQNVHEALDYLKDQGVCLGWLDVLTSLNPEGELQMDAPVSMVYIIGLAEAVETEKLTQNDIQMAYEEAIRKFQTQRDEVFLTNEDLAPCEVY